MTDGTHDKSAQSFMTEDVSVGKSGIAGVSGDTMRSFCPARSSRGCVSLIFLVGFPGWNLPEVRQRFSMR